MNCVDRETELLLRLFHLCEKFLQSRKKEIGVERIGEFEVHYNKLDVPHIFIFELEPQSVLILRGARPVCYAQLTRNVLQIGSIENVELCVEQLELALGGAT